MDNFGVINELIQNNCILLAMQSTLLRNIDVDLYGRKQKYFLGSSVGGHIRHILDHYSSFVEAIENDSRLIDYEKRIRGTDIETDPHSAAVKSTDIGQFLLQFSHQIPGSLSVQNESPEPGNRVRVSSSAERELSFLLSHTVHHHAIIAAILACANVQVPEAFGFAPSTLRYQTKTN